MESAKDESYSRDSLKKLFHRSLGLIEKWFIVLDGIDECNSEERRGLFGFLSDLLADENASGKFKLLLSCRETLNHDIRTWFTSALHVVTGSKTTSQDILTYAEDILHEKLSKGELVLGNINLAKEILRSISLKEQGMYGSTLLVSLLELFTYHITGSYGRFLPLKIYAVENVMPRS